jgi:multidrug efflux system outer membrane protein
VKRRLLTLLTIAAAAWASGCKVGPNYTRPQTETPAEFRNAQPGAAGAKSLGDYAWWEVLDDPTLQSLIRTALEQNKDLRIAMARVSQARALLKISRADLLPTVSGEASYQRSRMSEIDRVPIAPNIAAPNDAFSLTANASYEVDLWGRVRRLNEAARAQLLATEASRHAIMTVIIADVASAYFSLRDLDWELEIARHTVELRRKSLKLTTSRDERGVASKMDVRQSEVLLNTATAVIPQIEQNIATTENHICVLLGRNPAPVPRGKPLTNLVARIVVPAGLPSELLERRPDIIEAEQQLIAANANIGAAKAAFYPQITLTGSAGVLSADGASLFKGPANAWSFGPRITVPIFTGGRLTGQVEEMKASQRQALAAYEQAIQNAFRETADALITHAKTREYRIEHESLTNTLRDASRLANLRYRGGVSSYLEVLDTERQLFDAERQLARAFRDQLLSVAQLYKALGGGWWKETALPVKWGWR